MTSSAMLQSLDALLNEFYQAGTPSSRRREIEAELIAFKQQTDSWQLCLRVTVAGEANQIVWFFCTSALEHAITRGWIQLTAADRTLLRDSLWNMYANSGSNMNVAAAGGCMPRRQRDMIAKLIALMGKREFPDEHPNYMLHCIELIKTNFNLGIFLLLTTSEEVVSSREDVTTERKNYFHSCISMCIPDVMDLVTKCLLIAVCHINGKDIHSIPNTIMDYNLITTLPNDNQLSASLLELLSCVQHLVSWIRTELISEYFLMSILDLAQYRDAYQEVSLASLTVLNELLYLQKPLPYAMTLMSGINGLLDQHNTTKQQSEMYVDKFREQLRLYTTKYWPKMLQANDLLENFLKSLYCCTIFKNGALDFTEKLEIWTPIIKGLVMSSKLQRYNDIVHQLVAEIMRRMQFEYNKIELELLDNEIMEDNSQNEWQQFLTQCIECIALIAEARPNAVFAQVFSHWSRPYNYLQSIQNDIDCGKCYELTRKLKCQTFNEHLRDFSTVCQAVVRIAPLLEATANDIGSAEVNCNKQLLTENLLTTLKFLTSNKLANLNLDKSTFQTDLEHLYAQVLMAIRSILTISNINLKSEELLHSLFDMLGGIFQPSTVTLAPVVYLAASQLLLGVSTQIRPKCLLEIPTIINLMQAGPRLTHLPKQVIANVYISLIAYLALPWKNVDEPLQDFPRRSLLLREYVECLAQNLIELDLNATETKVAANTIELLNTFCIVIKFFKDSSNTTKDILTTTFKPIITKALIIYNNFGLRSNKIAIAIAEFSVSVLGTLQNQLGTQFIKEMITLFITVSSREQLSSNRFSVMEKILQMFQIVVEQPGNASISMLPSILDFVIDQILPLLLYDQNIVINSDISNLVYTLFDSILTCKWQYFYKSNVQHNGSLLQTSSENLHPQHFLSILNSYGQVLVSGNDPSVVQTVLLSMQNINERWRLYQRPLFKESLLASFQRAVINVLLSGVGGLHFDILANVLFAMGQVDTLKLRESFATATGFSINLKIIDEICLSTDIPTFSQKLTQLIQDAHCTHITQT